MVGKPEAKLETESETNWCHQLAYRWTRKTPGAGQRTKQNETGSCKDFTLERETSLIHFSSYPDQGAGLRKTTNTESSHCSEWFCAGAAIPKEISQMGWAVQASKQVIKIRLQSLHHLTCIRESLAAPFLPTQNQK